MTHGTHAAVRQPVLGRPPIRPAGMARRLLAVASVAVASIPILVIAPSPASAAGCAARVTRPFFSQWGDPNEYFAAPNGGFENRRNAWDIDGFALVVPENEPWQILGRRDRLSLAMLPGAVATTDPICVHQNEDSLRMFVKAPGVPGSHLDVRVELVTASGQRGVLVTRLSGSTGGWQVGPKIPAPSVAPLPGGMTDPPDTTSMTVSLRPGGTWAVWQIDDLMIDPWKTR